MSIEKAEKRQKLIDRAQGKTNEPIITDEGSGYATQLSHALNWHSRESDGKKRKAWVLSYLKQAKRTADIEALTDVSEWHFYSLGALVRLKMLDSVLSERHEQYIEDRIEEIKNTAPKVRAIAKTNAAIAVLTVNIQDRILEKAREVMGNIEGDLDDFYLDGCPANFKIKTPIKSYNPQILKHITNFIKPRIAELKEVQEGTDKQLVEGYSNFTKVQLKRYIALLEDLSVQCEEQKVAAKAVRKPRARKAKPASVQVAKMKFLKEDAELKLKSVNPADIIGADELWVYSTKYRRLAVYRAANSNGLGVKGTTITNYTVQGSGMKTLRKPEEFLPKVLSTPKRSLGPEFRNLKTKESQPNGRINEETILVRTFK
jgi:hypothetical protein